MPSAKEVVIRPISAADANRIIERYHYSHSVVRNSQLHLGAFLHGRCLGAMSFGPSLDKRKLQGLVARTPWNGFIELNRMAFSDQLPRNSESRSLGVAMRLLRQNYQHLQWVVSFADGSRCGDGTIYRASGFVLTAIRRNTSMWQGPDGTVISRTTVTKGKHTHGDGAGAASMRAYRDQGYAPIPGFQLRYVYFLQRSARHRLTVPIIPFSQIHAMGAGMYRGEPRAGSIAGDATGDQPAEGGSSPTPALAP